MRGTAEIKGRRMRFRQPILWERKWALFRPAPNPTLGLPRPRNPGPLCSCWFPSPGLPGSGSVRGALIALFVAFAALVGCNNKPLASSPCGSVDAVTQVQPLILSVSGSFPDTTSTQLVLVITTPSGTTRQFPSSSLTFSTAIIPLSALPRLPSGTYPAQWLMTGCETPHQTLILGPAKITLTT
jgi:hypothetical protein